MIQKTFLTTQELEVRSQNQPSLIFYHHRLSPLGFLSIFNTCVKICEEICLGVNLPVKERSAHGS